MIYILSQLQVSHIGPNGASGIIEVSLSIEQSEEFFFLCIRENNTGLMQIAKINFTLVNKFNSNDSN